MPETAEPPKYAVKPGAADPYATWLKRTLQQDRGLLASRYDPEGKFVFTGAFDYFVHRWDLSDESEEGKRLTLAGHESWVRALAWFPTTDPAQQLLVSGDYVGRLIVWPALAEKPEPKLNFPAHEGSIRSVAVSPDGKSIASAGNDGFVRVWSAEDGKKILELSGHDCHVYQTAFHPDGKSLISVDLKGVVKHWELPSGKLVRELDASLLYIYSEKYTVDVGGIRGMSFNADGSRLACAGATGERGIAHSGSARVLLFDWESGEVKHEFQPGHEEICTAWGVKFHPDGFLIGSGGSRTGGYLWFWQEGEDEAFHQVKFKQRAPGFDLDLAPDLKTLAVANHDGAVRFWEMATEPEPPAEAAKKKT
ncbi:MAG: WD40 repeat protein [Verrucomicrobiales bacterium]|jgi:WD40 repeat protein